MLSMATRTDKQSPVQPVADSHDLIRGHGGRVNNLKDVSVEIRKRSDPYGRATIEAIARRSISLP
jgi:hypothetical protein